MEEVVSVKSFSTIPDTRDSATQGRNFFGKKRKAIIGLDALNARTAWFTLIPVFILLFILFGFPNCNFSDCFHPTFPAPHHPVQVCSQEVSCEAPHDILPSAFHQCAPPLFLYPDAYARHDQAQPATAELRR